MDQNYFLKIKLPTVQYIKQKVWHFFHLLVYEIKVLLHLENRARNADTNKSCALFILTPTFDRNYITYCVIMYFKFMVLIVCLNIYFCCKELLYLNFPKNDDIKSQPPLHQNHYMYVYYAGNKQRQANKNKTQYLNDITLTH